MYHHFRGDAHPIATAAADYDDLDAAAQRDFYRQSQRSGYLHLLPISPERLISDYFLCRRWHGRRFRSRNHHRR